MATITQRALQEEIYDECPSHFRGRVHPIGLVVGGAVKVASEVDGSATIDGAAERTADEIAEQLIEAAKKQGWI